MEGEWKERELRKGRNGGEERGEINGGEGRGRREGRVSKEREKEGESGGVYHVN